MEGTTAMKLTECLQGVSRTKKGHKAEILAHLCEWVIQETSALPVDFYNHTKQVLTLIHHWIDLFS